MNISAFQKGSLGLVKGSWAVFAINCFALVFAVTTCLGAANEPGSLTKFLNFKEAPISPPEEEVIEKIMYEDYVKRVQKEGVEPKPFELFLAMCHVWETGVVISELPDYVFVGVTDSYVVALYRPNSGIVSAPEHKVLRRMNIEVEYYSQPVMGDSAFLTQLASILSSGETLTSERTISKTGPIIAYIYHWYYVFGNIPFWEGNPPLLRVSENPRDFLTSRDHISKETRVAINTLPEGGVFADAENPGVIGYTFYTFGAIPPILREWIVIYEPVEGFYIKEILIGRLY